MDDAQHNITQALMEADAGQQEAAERLWGLVYDYLREIAHRELQAEYGARTLSTTGLVHEAYFKLIDHTRITWQNRAHFFGLACRAMRRILVDHARRRNAQKRGGNQEQVPLDKAIVMAEDRSEALLALDQALTRLAVMDERLGQVVECRFFGDLSIKDTAEVIGVSTRTVERDWQRARAYLYRALCPSVETHSGGRPLGLTPYR